MRSLHTGSRLDVIDGLRGIAIGLVVWYHAWLVSGQSIGAVNFIAEAGFLGVDLFFFISGFCIFAPYARALRSGFAEPSKRRFFARRARKIIPSYLVALVVFALVYHDRFSSPVDAVLAIASHVTFTHTLAPQTYGSISGPLWTLGVEVQFYLLFPLISPIFRRAPIATYAVLIVIAETYRIVLAANGLGSTFSAINQLPAFIDVFGSGMFTAYALSGWKSDALPPRRFATMASVATFGFALAGLFEVASIARNIDINTAYDRVNSARIAIGPLCTVLALSTTIAGRRWQAVLTSRPIMFLSLISYNVYLWNLEVAVWYEKAGLTPALTFGLSIVTTLAIATAMTYGFERPLLYADLGAWRSGLGASLDRLGARGSQRPPGASSVA